MSGRNAKVIITLAVSSMTTLGGPFSPNAFSAAVPAATPAMKVEPGNSRAFLQHWVDTLNSLGAIDKGVTADYPLYNVYTKAGRRIYVVYNLTDKPLAVKFSDGTRIDCATRGFKSVSKTTHLGS
ncbi:MAG: hypothetical protein WCP22_11565 [Chlamydiota bacterium]